MEIEDSENSNLENESLSDESLNNEINTSLKKEKKENKFISNKDFKNNILKIENDSLLDKISNSKYTCEEKEMNMKERKDIKTFIDLEKNPLNIIPKNNNLDLKRNISERYNILKSMTNNVIKEMIKQKIENQKNK